jgi:hypothetical protein
MNFVRCSTRCGLEGVMGMYLLGPGRGYERVQMTDDLRISGDRVDTTGLRT